MGTVAALSILNQSLATAIAISALISKAKAENRDVTIDELNALASQDDVARLKLDEAIKKAGG